MCVCVCVWLAEQEGYLVAIFAQLGEELVEEHELAGGVDERLVRQHVLLLGRRPLGRGSVVQDASFRARDQVRVVAALVGPSVVEEVR